MNWSSSHPLPSERSFGFLFVGVFAVLAAYFAYKTQSILLVAIFSGLSALTLAVTVFKPGLLRPFNKAWFLLGLLLGLIVSPIVMGLIFFLVISPVAIAMKLAGRDALRLRKSTTNSYWIARTPAGPEPNSFKNQF